MEILFKCSRCAKPTKHVVVTSSIIKQTIHTRLKCYECDEKVFTWITANTDPTNITIYVKLNKLET